MGCDASGSGRSTSVSAVSGPDSSVICSARIGARHAIRSPARLDAVGAEVRVAGDDVHPSVRHCATSSRSNGSRRWDGIMNALRVPAQSAASRSPRHLVWSGRSSGAVSLPSARLIAISHTLAALTHVVGRRRAIPRRRRRPGVVDRPPQERAGAIEQPAHAVYSAKRAGLVEVVGNRDPALQRHGTRARRRVVGDDLASGRAGPRSPHPPRLLR